MKRRLLSNIRSLVSASLSQEGVHFLGASHPPSNFNFDVNFNILGLILILHDRQPAGKTFNFSISRAKAILKI
jgi:hypothetical protein